MAKVRILKKDGTPSRYFWSDKESTERTNKTIYKETTDGVRRMKGAHFDAVTNEVQRHQ
jgi:hypothetical protein